MTTFAVGLVTALMLIVAMALGAAGLGLIPGAITARPNPKQTRVVPTQTPLPTATTAASTATATPNPQIALNQEAASAFRGVTVAAFADRSCSGSNQRTTFSSGQAVYVNLCVGPRTMPGPVTVQIMSNGAVYRTLMDQQSLIRSGTYWLERSLGQGTYDVVVTVTINGQTATAKDIRITVG